MRVVTLLVLLHSVICQGQQSEFGKFETILKDLLGQDAQESFSERDIVHSEQSQGLDPQTKLKYMVVVMVGLCLFVMLVAMASSHSLRVTAKRLWYELNPFVDVKERKQGEPAPELKIKKTCCCFRRRPMSKVSPSADPAQKESPSEAKAAISQVVKKTGRLKLPPLQIEQMKMYSTHPGQWRYRESLQKLESLKRASYRSQNDELMQASLSKSQQLPKKRIARDETRLEYQTALMTKDLDVINEKSRHLDESEWSDSRLEISLDAPSMSHESMTGQNLLSSKSSNMGFNANEKQLNRLLKVDKKRGEEQYNLLQSSASDADDSKNLSLRKRVRQNSETEDENFEFECSGSFEVNQQSQSKIGVGLFGNQFKKVEE